MIVNFMFVQGCVEWEQIRQYADYTFICEHLILLARLYLRFSFEVENIVYFPNMEPLILC